MALTQAMVIKIILSHIGGSKVLGNGSSVTIAGKPVVVKAGGVGGISSLALGSVVSNLANLGSISAVTTSLQRNPLTDRLTSLASAQTDLSAQIAAITTLPSTVSTTLTDSLASFANQISTFTTHTNVLSGLELDVTAIPENSLMLNDISGLGVVAMESLGMTKSEVLASANSLYSANTVETYVASINPNEPNGISDIVFALSQAADSGSTEEDLQAIADSFASNLNEYTDNLAAIQAADLAAQADLKLRVDSLNILASILPDTSNEISTEFFNLVATDELQEINTQLQANT